jgi:TonB family protein
VLLPESFARLGEAEQKAVACHELLHVMRRDSWALLLEEGARAFLWAQPAAWAVLSGISLSREQAVDRAAVESTGDRRAYLRALAVLARLSQESPAAALPFHTRSHLVRRVAHLTKEVPMSRTRISLATAIAAASLLLVGAAGAAAFPFGADPQPPADKAAPAKGSSVAADNSDVLKVGGDVKEPVELSRAQPVYPEEARKNGIQGIVKLSAVIDAKGTVTKVEPIESPDPTLAAAAVDAVKKWTYKPATLKGKPVKVIMTVTVNFRLA